MSILFLLLCICSAVVIWLVAGYFISGFLYTDIPAVSYSITGNKKGKPMCFIHGWPDSPIGWNGQVEYFKKNYLCINFELPNYNKDNIHNPWGYDVPNVVKGIANQLQYIIQTKYPQYEKDGVILVIHDWGSIFGQLLIKNYPSLVSHAIIVDIGNSFPNKRCGDILKTMSYQFYNIFCFLLPRSIGDKLMRSFVYKMDERFMKVPAVQHEKKTGKKILHAGMNYPYFYVWKSLLFHCGAPAKLTVPKCPTYFAHGKWLGPWHTKRWKKELTERNDCEYIGYDKAKHWVMYDQCDTFNKGVETWLDKHKK